MRYVPCHFAELLPVTPTRAPPVCPLLVGSVSTITLVTLEP